MSRAAGRAAAPAQRTLHGITITDDYAWLKDANWQEVLRDPSLLDPDIRAYLEAENRYTEACSAPTQALQKTLVAEMRGRIKEDDSGVPTPDGPFAYLWKYPRGRPARADRPHRRATAATSRSSSTAMRWPRRRTTSSSAARGIRPTTGSKPGAPTCAARSISPSASGAGTAARTCPTSLDADRRQRRLGPRFDVLLLCPARRQPPAAEGLPPSARHAAERRRPGLRGEGHRLVHPYRGKRQRPLLHHRRRRPRHLRAAADRSFACRTRRRG